MKARCKKCDYAEDSAWFTARDIPESGEIHVGDCYSPTCWEHHYVLDQSEINGQLIDE